MCIRDRAEAVDEAAAEAARDGVYSADECLATAVDAATTVAAHAAVEAALSNVVVDEATAVGAVECH